MAPKSEKARAAGVAEGRRADQPGEDQDLAGAVESLETYRAIFDHARVGMALFGLNGEVLLANQAATELLGYGLDELRHLGVLAITHPEDRGISRRKLKRLVSGRVDSYCLRKRFLHRDGRIVWTNTTASLIRNARGEPSAVLGSLEDVTEVMRAQEAQRFLSEASRVLASSLDYETTLRRVAELAVPDLADWCSLYLVGEDGALRQVTTVARDPAKAEVLRKLGGDYLPRTSESQTSLVWKVAQSGEARLVTRFDQERAEQTARDAEHVRLIRQLGARARIVVPLIARDGVLGVLALGHAESGRSYTPDDLARAEELARRCAVAIENARLYAGATDAIRLRDEFLSVAAHELKTPLTSLLGMAQLLERTLDRNGSVEPDRLRKRLAGIRQQSLRLARLVNQLLDVSRIDGGRLTLQREPTDVVALVEGVVAAARAWESGHAIVVQATDRPSVSVDPLRFEQVLTNLLDNAMKYSPAGSRIEVHLDSMPSAGVTVRVIDQGIGVPPEHRALVFDRFYQAHADSYLSGLGLGLYISRHIVELHGGTLVAVFPEDGGTHFVVRVPGLRNGKDG